jgi:hypothetical protein
LGGTTKNHLKEWLKNQKHPNHFSCLSIACSNIWLQVYLGISKKFKNLKFTFLTKIALKKININFGNS